MKPALLTTLALALVIAATLPRSAQAERIIADLSADLVRVTSEFRGERLSLFGVIERDAQTVARTGKYQVVVVVQGPRNDVLVQAKARTLGVWMNARGERFASVPSYYAIHASESAREIIEEDSAAGGPLSLAGVTDADPAKAEFLDAYIRQRRSQFLYREEIGAVDMLTNTFFRTLIPLPGLAEDGEYEVNVYLYVGGVLLDVHELSFSVAKVGFEQNLSQLARDRPLVYGVAVVLLALVTGYLGGMLFKRN